MHQTVVVDKESQKQRKIMCRHSRPLPGDANNDIDDGLPELVGWKCAMTICVF